MAKDNAKKWLEMRSRGRTRFLLVDGIWKQGVLFATLMTSYKFFDDDKPLDPLKIVLSFLFLGLGFGYTVGCLEWWSAKRAYFKDRDPGIRVEETNPVPGGRWQRFDRSGIAIEAAVVLGIVLSLVGLGRTDEIILWHRGAIPADETGLLAYWSFDDCTAKDNSSHGFDGKIHQARCIDGPSGKALLLNKNGGYLSFPRIMDSILHEMSITYCRRSEDESRGWRAVAVTASYFDFEERFYDDGRFNGSSSLPKDGYFPRGDEEFGRGIHPRKKQMEYYGGAIDELRIFARKLNPEEIKRISKECRLGRN